MTLPVNNNIQTAFNYICNVQEDETLVSKKNFCHVLLLGPTIITSNTTTIIANIIITIIIIIIIITIILITSITTCLLAGLLLAGGLLPVPTSCCLATISFSRKPVLPASSSRIRCKYKYANMNKNY